MLTLQVMVLRQFMLNIVFQAGPRTRTVAGHGQHTVAPIDT